jgi:hypothetical protein
MIYKLDLADPEYAGQENDWGIPARYLDGVRPEDPWEVTARAIYRNAAPEPAGFAAAVAMLYVSYASRTSGNPEDAPSMREILAVVEEEAYHAIIGDEHY